MESNRIKLFFSWDACTGFRKCVSKMAIIKQFDKRSGRTYVYESVAYWDKEKRQARAHRRLIGRLDEATGEVIPTDGRGHKRRTPEEMRAQKREKVKAVAYCFVYEDATTGESGIVSTRKMQRLLGEIQ